MRNISRLITVTSSAVLLASLAACVAPPVNTTPVSTYPAQTYPQTYPQTSQSNYVEYGRVSNVEVLRTPDQAASTTGVGAILGGVAGAAVGSQIGGGSGRTAATVVGAVGGAVAGNAIERNRATANVNVRESYRVSVQLDNGTSRAYDVPSYGELRIGDRVKIENNQLYRML
ncbi:MAG TPA: glycine zipper 2TM domain-containing protein [Polaromonas sp.]|uniref:glycine zipper 2TM domain-containing protein n=1 Tax=Polaromonas sp. TaxID=1869339 RepID=UPI002D476D56|nr:glycine zipper 2TM domain-containing protein [Polaromonas sp.]HYW55658.1 glycine zipper 2TM domain-containing protein [Polaromonas sp.]